MKLSEALRLGEFAIPGIYGNWLRLDGNGKPCGGCAVGRMCIAAGFQPALRNYYHLEVLNELASFTATTWPWTAKHTVKYPADTWGDTDPAFFEDEYGVENDVLAAISDLYEEARWSITQIADWVATIEPKENHDLQPIAVKDLSGMQYEAYAQPGGMD